MNSVKVHGGSGIPFGFVETKLGSENIYLQHMICYISYTGCKIYSRHPFKPFSELWKSLYAYDTVHHSWLLLDEKVSKENELPRGLYGHTINVINGYVYLFGGTSGTFYFNTIYRLVHVYFLIEKYEFSNLENI